MYSDILMDIDLSKFQSLDQFYRMTQFTGSMNRAISNNLYGINHRNIKSIIPENRDSYGLVFFTRPQLNLTNANLRNVRKFYSLLTTNPNSIHRYVRNMLDPRLAQWTDGGFGELIDKAAKTISTGKIEKSELYANMHTPIINCPMVDENLAFIPILTNTIKSMSGWPDIVLPSYTSKEGARREQWIMADGAVDIYESFDIDCTFRNIKDEPLVLLFETWLRYMSLVYEGMISPYFDFVIENEIDYMTRIYRLVLDENKTYVKKIAAVGAGFPVNVPNGKFFDFEDSEKYNNNNKDINIRFKCIGAEYNDDILVHEFNATSAIFNPDIKKLINTGRSDTLARVPFNLLELFNNRGYPLIDKNTLELRWYVNKNSVAYKEVINAFSRIQPKYFKV